MADQSTLHTKRNTMTKEDHDHERMPAMKRFCHKALLLEKKDKKDYFVGPTTNSLSKSFKNQFNTSLSDDDSNVVPIMDNKTKWCRSSIDPSVSAGALDLLSFAAKSAVEPLTPDKVTSSTATTVTATTATSSESLDAISRIRKYSLNQLAGPVIESSDLRAEDVLCGRGLGNSNRAGNVRFRALIQSHSCEYRQANSTLDKNMIANYIMDSIKPGRFLRREKNPSLDKTKTNSKFIFVELIKREALEKTCQALRDASSASHHRGVDDSLTIALEKSPDLNSPSEVHTALIETLRQQQEERGNDSEFGVNIRSNDVLLGRGGFTNHFPGNLIFRKLIVQYQVPYFRASKTDKPRIANEVVQKIRNTNGRFLKKIASGEWRDVGDSRAREKVSQALREKGPELKELLGPSGHKDSSDDESKIDSNQFLTKLHPPHLGLGSNYFTEPITQSSLPASESPQWIPPSPVQVVHASRHRDSDDLHITIMDVLCGRGAGVNRHPGNIVFRKLVAAHRREYKNAITKKLKSTISRSIVNDIRAKGGRFLRRAKLRYNDSHAIASDTDSFVWVEVNAEKAVEKTSQALRESESEQLPTRVETLQDRRKHPFLRIKLATRDIFDKGSQDENIDSYV